MDIKVLLQLPRASIIFLKVYRLNRVMGATRKLSFKIAKGFFKLGLVWK